MFKRKLEDISDFEFNVLAGGGYFCPNTGRAVATFSDDTDDKFICTACGQTHIKKMCKPATKEQVYNHDGF